MSSSTGRSDALARGYVDRIASLLHDHIELLEVIERYSSLIASSRAGGEDQAILGDLRESLESLAALRSAIIEDLEKAVSLAERGLAPQDSIEDLLTLAGYYLEAGIEREMKALERAGGYVDVSLDIRGLEEARSKARSFLERLEDVRGRGEKGG